MSPSVTVVAMRRTKLSVLESVAANAQKFGIGNLRFLLLEDPSLPPDPGDPASPFAFAGYPFEIWSRRRQIEYVAQYSGLLARHLGMDSPERRAVGLLRAYELGSEVTILLDQVEDLGPADMLGPLTQCSSHYTGSALRAPAGWYPTTRLAQPERPAPYYPRGYPRPLRWQASEDFSQETVEALALAACVGGLGGLPDVDAFTRLDGGPNLAAVAIPATVFAPGTWCPFGANLVALRWESIPAFFLSPSLHAYAGVWASFLLCRLAQHVGHGILHTSNLAQRSAQQPDVWHELDRDRPGVKRSPELAEILRTLALPEAGYRAGVRDIALQLERAWPQGSLRGPQAWSGYEVEWRLRFLDGLHGWVEALESLQAAAPARLQLALAAHAQGSAQGVVQAVGNTNSVVSPKPA
ncbi:MAG: hypothetical protein NW208_18060 [Bryobacter sp.]|nr:hypothetical protein [Bryobacter sp.]